MQEARMHRFATAILQGMPSKDYTYTHQELISNEVFGSDHFRVLARLSCRIYWCLISQKISKVFL
jgi:hypothetical protein